MVSAQKVSDTAGGFTAILDDEDQFGRSIVNLGDLDGDGITDLLVGAHTDDDGGLDKGAVYVLFMRANGFVKSFQKISALEGNFSGWLDPGDQFGRAAACLGDLDGDGVVDLAVSSNYDDDGGANKGAVYILFLNVNGTVKAVQKISSLQGGLPANLKIHDEFGRSITSLGDLDGDGHTDIVVGTPEDDEGGTNTGALHVLFLNANGTVKGYHRISRATEGLRLKPGDWFGHSSANIGDFNHDGVVDIVVGSVLDDDGGVNQGSVWILFLRRDGSVLEAHEINELMGGFTAQLDDIDQFGTSVCALGDLDGDGVTDIAVGAVKDDDGGNAGNPDADVGAVYVLFLNPDATVKAWQKISDTSGDLPYKLDQYDWFGSALCRLGGSPGDGLFNLAIGCRNDDDGNPNRGSIYLVQLNDGTAPAAQFAASATLGVAPMTVSFQDQSTGEVTSWLWNFGDGPQSIAQNPVKTYSVPGVYDVQLTAKGPKGKDVEPKHAFITVSAGPLADFTATPVQGLAPLDVAFEDRSLGQVTSWWWDFGDGQGSSKASPRHVFGPGTYSVSLTVSGPNGTDTRVRTNLVTCVALAPAADFAPASAAGFAPLTVDFSDLSTGDVSAWTWSFGDGSSSSEANPSHTFVLPGTFTVSLTASGAHGSSTATRTECVVVTSAVPEARLAAAPETGNAPLEVRFSDLSTGNITSWLWSFGDGATSSARNPVHVYSDPGSYDVQLLVAGPLGSHVAQRPGLVVVSEPPPVSEFLISSEGGFAPLTIGFTDQSSGQVTGWHWSFGDGHVSGVQNPSHTYLAPGRYSVTLTVSGPSGADSLTKMNLITVEDPTPAADFSAPQSSGVAPLAVHFADASHGDIDAWTWSFGDGTGSTEREPEHVYLVPGSYTVRLSVSGPAGEDVETKTAFVVVATPPPAADFNVAPSTGFAPLDAQFSDQSTGALSSWLWSFGDGATSSVQNPAHVYTAPGTYTAVLTVVGAGGANSTARTVVVMDPAPVAAFDAAPRSGNAPLSVQFANTSSGLVSGQTWNFGDGSASTEADPVHVFTTPGTYAVSLKVSGPSGTDQRVVTDFIQVQWPVATPEFSAGPSAGFAPHAVSFADLSTGNVTSWSWNFGDGTTSRQRNPTKVYTRTGNFTATLTVKGPGGVRSISHGGILVSARPVFPDGDFELQVAGTEPGAPWRVFAGNDIEVRSSAAPDAGFACNGTHWLDIGTDGSTAATPPTHPGAAGAMPGGAVGVEQVFSFQPLAPHLVFDAAFLLGEVAGSVDRNDFMSVELTDGTTVWNVFHADGFDDFPAVSSIHGLAMTAVERVHVDLRTLFPGAVAGQGLTLRVSLGNGGDGLVSSHGYVDAFTLVPAASASFRNGTGRNAARYVSSAPVLGGAWTVQVDTTGHATPRLIQLVGLQRPAAGVMRTTGEVLVSGKKLFAQSWRATPGLNVQTIRIPLDYALIGQSLATQVTITGGTAELCNAYDLVLGL